MPDHYDHAHHGAHVHDGHPGHQNHGHAHDHRLMPQFYVLLALFGLTVLTYVASLFHLGPFADLVALVIAIGKASLVVLFFMHVKESTSLIKLCAVSGFFWTLLFFVYLLGDVHTRDGQTLFEGWQDPPRKVYAEKPAH
jgi:cytochrome c oxidase subunit 4